MPCFMRMGPLTRMPRWLTSACTSSTHCRVMRSKGVRWSYCVMMSDSDCDVEMSLKEGVTTACASGGDARDFVFVAVAVVVAVAAVSGDRGDRGDTEGVVIAAGGDEETTLGSGVAEEEAGKTTGPGGGGVGPEQ